MRLSVSDDNYLWGLVVRVYFNGFLVHQVTAFDDIAGWVEQFITAVTPGQLDIVRKTQSYTWIYDAHGDLAQIRRFGLVQPIYNKERLRQYGKIRPDVRRYVKARLRNSGDGTTC